MTITVYWACCEDQWMMAEEPSSVAKAFYSKNIISEEYPSSQINYCPSFNKNLHNLFAIKSLYDYEFTISHTIEGSFDVKSSYLNQEFYNKHVKVRDPVHKFFSFRNSYIFFADCDSLNVTFYEYPFLEDNNITERCMIVAGQFNIAKWFRNTEFAFYLKQDFDTFKIERGEVYSYVRFHTDEKIKFKQFRYTKLLKEYNEEGFALNGFMRTLSNYYNFFKNKRFILQEIKKNLI